MTPDWAATLFCNLILAALLIACRPSRCGFLWAYVGLALCADWFCLSNLEHLKDELFNFPWHVMDIAGICAEVLMLTRICRRDCWQCTASSCLVIVHLMLRYAEYSHWENYEGPARLLPYLNLDGWRFFYMGQSAQVVSAIGLGTVILALRTEREEELPCTMTIASQSTHTRL